MNKLIVIILTLIFFAITIVFALPPNDFEPWRMYATHENGYDAGKEVLKGTFGNVSILQGCIEQSDHSSWESMGWDNKTIRKADKIFFYGCINASNRKMTKKEFMKEMFKDMTAK